MNNQKNISTVSKSKYYKFGDDVSRMAGNDVRRLPAAPPTLVTRGAEVVSFSIDTLHIVYDFEWLGSDLFARLLEAKKGLQMGFKTDIPFDLSGIGAFIWNLSRTGNKFYPYIMRSEDVTLYLSGRKAGTGIPNVMVQIGSISCQSDLEEKLSKIIWWLESIAGKVVSEKVSRIDLAADINEDIKRCDFDDLDLYIGRADKHDLHYSRKKFTGISVGNGDISLRIYDKTQEMKEKGNMEKLMFFYHKWKLSLKQKVTRVEYQLRGDAIKELFGSSAKKLVDVKRGIPNVWNYLTTKWFRHVNTEVDRTNKNQAKNEISDIWKVVVESVGVMAEGFRIKVNKSYNVDALRKQMIGIMMTICSAMGVEVDDYKGLKETSEKVVRSELYRLVMSGQHEEKYLRKEIRRSLAFV